MRISVLMGLLTLLTLQINGQESFLTFLEPSSLGYFVKEIESGYAVGGFGAVDFGEDAHFLFQANTEGALSGSWIFSVDSLLETEIRPRGFSESLDGSIYACGQYVGIESTKGALIKYNAELTDTLYTIPPIVLGSFTSLIFCKEFGVDSLLILGVVQTIQFQSEVLILCTDTLGNIHWQNNIVSPGEDIIPVDASFTQDGGFLITCNDVRFFGTDSEPHNTVFKTDHFGNVEWSVKPGDWLTHHTASGGTVLHEDDSFTTFWTENYFIHPPGMGSDQPVYNRTIYYANYSSLGILTSEGNYNDILPFGINGPLPYRHLIYHVTPWPDGTIMISGNNFREGFLLKVTANGEYLWHRTYSPIDDLPNYATGTRTHLYGVYPASDGSILAAGEFRSNPGDLYPQGIQTSILLKVDSMGCLDTLDCVSVGLPHPQPLKGSANALRVYPNPTSGMVWVELPARTPNPQRGSPARVELVDHYGRVINLSTLSYQELATERVEMQLPDSPGLYHIRLIMKEGVWMGKVMRE